MTQATHSSGNQEMRELVDRLDWSATPLGPAEQWPQSLKTLAEICLASKFPAVIWWGPQRTQIYNNGYREILGEKHPRALGQTAAECWNEIWELIEPMIASVFDTGEAVWVEDSLFSVERSGYLEEAYFTFSYTPVRDESGAVNGIFETVAEVTSQILARRRLTMLRELGEAATVRSIDGAYAAAAKTLAQHPHDIPFALLYRLDEETDTAVLKADAGLTPGHRIALPQIAIASDDPFGFRRVLATAAPFVLDGREGRFAPLPGGPWPEPARTVVVLPIERPGERRPFGFFVAGVSPRRALDDAALDFLRLAAQQSARALSAANAYELERKRAEKLAELDQAKTTFFNNVSHEFRTPLTLILGPLEAALTQSPAMLAGDELAIVHRSASRLLRLVNSLLDYARIESGRFEGVFVPVDLATVTTGLANSFRPLVERGGIGFEVDCEALPEPVYVLPIQWEKIVLNLLSNAFKFTLKGTVAVRLRHCGDHVELRVSDTGCGIPERELPRMFERFHRVEGAKGRSFEGTGIGLCLVNEFVQLHGGSVAITSKEGEGSTFVVSLPTGRAHLPPERVASAGEAPAPKTATAHDSYVSEATAWDDAVVEPRASPPANPDAVAAGGNGRESSTRSAYVLVADDNADMRQHLARILSARWRVECVRDGLEALESARSHPPDLILSDVMMPGMDGFALLRELRSDPRTRQIPLVLLSARAGEGPLLEGIEMGADDYVVKPFSARELLARVHTHLEMGRLRRQWANELERANAELEAFSYSVSHDLRTPLRAIDGFSKLLLEDPAARLDARGRGYLDRVRAASQRMGGLIDDLLDLSRISRTQLRRERIDLSVLAKRILAALAERSPERKVVLRVEENLVADADLRFVTVLLENLLGNAWKYTARKAEARIEFGSRREGADGETVFFVRDDGVGFDMNHASQLFAPFHRLHADAQFEGTGIGLAIVHRIVTRHDGRIRAEAAVDQGATFTFTLGGCP